ncbi:MAG: putative 2OG-Fe(II) oxygenase [Pseudohongiellaceae bacterium]
MTAKSLYKTGLKFHRAGNLQQASDYYSRALALQPDYVPAINNVALIARELGKLEVAASLLREALGHAPENFDVQINMGRVCMLRHREEEAETHFRNALTINPDSIEARLNLAHAVYARQDFPQARMLFEQLLQRDRQHFAALYNLAIIHLRENDREAANRYLERALTVKPEDMDALNQLAENHLLHGRLDEAAPLIDRSLAPRAFNTRALALKTVLLNHRRDEVALQRHYSYDLLLRVAPVEVSERFVSVAGFNQELVRFLDEQVIMERSPEGKATVKGLHSPTISHLPHETMSEMNRIITDAYDSAVAAIRKADHPFHHWIPSRCDIDSWTIRLHRGGFQRSHIHPRAWLSGCYYIKVPQQVHDGANSSVDAGRQGDSCGRPGWIEFGKPDEKYNVAEPLGCTDYAPVEGEIVTFPSYFWHNTIPFSSDEERISLAFDICPRDISPDR